MMNKRDDQQCCAHLKTDLCDKALNETIINWISRARRGGVGGKAFNMLTVAIPLQGAGHT